MARDATTPAKALAGLITDGKIQTALTQLRVVSPPKMQRAVLKRLEPMLSEDDRKWFWYQWMKGQHG